MVDLGCIWRFYIIMQLQPPKLDPSLLILPTAKCWGDDPKMEAKVLPRHIAGTMGLDPSPWSHHGSSLYSLNHAIFLKKALQPKDWGFSSNTWRLALLDSSVLFECNGQQGSHTCDGSCLWISPWCSSRACCVCVPCLTLHLWYCHP